ncbi:MAG: carboxypeptidase-like regulatory domain-containing protein, partial [Butyricimonas faecihominis]
MCIFFVFASFGSGLSQQKVNMNLGETTIKEALTEFQRVTHMIVIYSDDNFETTRKVVANFKNTGLDEFLTTLLKGSGMTYKLMEDYILIVPSKVSVADSLNQLKKYVVRGVVKDEKGGMMPGVTVLIKGTQVGVATDVDGKFELTTTDSSNLVLVFSFIGMKT